MQKLLAEGKTSTVIQARNEANDKAFGPPILNDYWAACQGADLIISAWDHLCLIPTMCCAEKLGVPWVPVALRPVVQTGEWGEEGEGRSEWEGEGRRRKGRRQKAKEGRKGEGQGLYSKGQIRKALGGGGERDKWLTRLLGFGKWHRSECGGCHRMA